MVKIERLVLQLFTVIFFSIDTNAARVPENSLGFLSQLLGKRSQSPLVVVLDPSSKANELNGFLRSKNLEIVGQDSLDDNDAINDKEAIHYVNEILRSTGDENDPVVQDTNNKFKQALRARCTKVLECEIKCEIKKKKEDKCKKSCKDVFDYLNMCGNKKKKKKDSCESDSDECREKKPKKNYCEKPKCKGFTMPPTWRF